MARCQYLLPNDFWVTAFKDLYLTIKARIRSSLSYVEGHLPENQGQNLVLLNVLYVPCWDEQIWRMIARKLELVSRALDGKVITLHPTPYTLHTTPYTPLASSRLDGICALPQSG